MKCNIMDLQVGHFLINPVAKDERKIKLYQQFTSSRTSQEGRKQLFIALIASQLCYRHMLGSITSINPNIPVNWVSYPNFAYEQNEAYARAKDQPVRIKRFIQDHTISGSAKILKPRPQTPSLRLFPLTIPSFSTFERIFKKLYVCVQHREDKQ